MKANETRCVHFTGLPLGGIDKTKKCKAGVEYRSHVGGPDLGWACRAPCVPDNKYHHAAETVACEHYRAPTAEEVAADEARIKAVLARMDTVITAIRPWRKANKGKSAAEIVECPICRGRLHLSIAACNGRVHGKCETTDCVSWME